MIITSVNFRKLVTDPGYSNKAVEASAAVIDGDDPELILIELRQWVEKQLGERALIADPVEVRNELNWIYEQRDRAKRELADAETRLEDIRDKIAKNSPDVDDDLPF